MIFEVIHFILRVYFLKSSCLVPLALNPEPGSHVIDAASAPVIKKISQEKNIVCLFHIIISIKKGNKTILLANILENSGLIHAFDIEEQRVKLMTENLKQHHVKNVRLKCMDFLATEVEKYDRIEYIMLDVPCSGSGMVARLKYGDQDIELQKDGKRLRNLEALQRRMLVHAMKFSSVKRIVYSTCSIHLEENENVVKYALKNCNKKYKLVKLFEDKWQYSRGINRTNKDIHVYHLDYCIRTSYDNNFTNGFFIACFELNEETEEEAAAAAETQAEAPASVDEAMNCESAENATNES